MSTDREDFDAIVSGLAEETPIATMYDQGIAMLELMGLRPALAEWIQVAITARIKQMVEDDDPALPDLNRLCERIGGVG